MDFKTLTDSVSQEIVTTMTVRKLHLSWIRCRSESGTNKETTSLGSRAESTPRDVFSHPPIVHTVANRKACHRETGSPSHAGVQNDGRDHAHL